MSARESRKSSSTATTNLPVPSPKTPRSSSKRRPEDASESSPATRRSKRVKPVKGDDAPVSAADGSEVVEGNGVGSHSTPVKTEGEQETKTSVTVKHGKNGAKTESKSETTAAVTDKTSKKRKTKEEKEAEAMPLRARTPGLRMLVGAHVSAAKGVFNSIHNSMHIGGNAFALFLKSQRKWDNPPLQDDHRDQFRQLCQDNGYDAAKHILPHGSYLVNLAQEDKAKAKQAYTSFLDDLHRCEALGIQLYNFHPGSANKTSLASALTRLAQALTNALSATTTVIPVLETMCGQGTTIGGSLTEFRDIISQIPSEYHSRIGICIDTCHSHAAGYDLVTPAGFQAFMQEFDDVVGLQHLRALHLNDSKTPCGSHRDLHANIGTGFLGLRAFHNIMNDSRLQDMPMVLETPIDRPAAAVAAAANTANDIHEACASEDEGEDSEADTKKKKKKQPAKASSTATVADPSVWAAEIALLESLIGMDADSEEFRSLEKKLADEGRAMREKHQEQFERKTATEEKKKVKELEKGQKSLADMMGKKK